MNKRLSFNLLFAIFILVILVFSTWANTKTIIVNQDTNIAENSKDSNYGKNGYTVVWKSAGWNNETWYKFELPIIESGQRIDEAYLKVFVYGEGDNSGPIGAFFCPDNNWDETTLTWNNAPRSKVESVPLAVATPTANNTIVSWDLGPFLRANREKTTFTFVLRSIADPLKRTVYYSKESGMTVPKIEYTTVAQNGGSVGGCISDSTGALIQEPTVSLLDSNRNEIRMTSGNNYGCYEFFDINPGNYILRVEKLPFAPFESSITIEQDSYVDMNAVLLEYEGSIEIKAMADTTADQSNPTGNTGSSNWTVIWNTTGYNKHTWYKFDLPSFPSNYRVKTAILKSYAMTNGDKIGNVGVFYCSNDNWEEGTLTWVNVNTEVENTPVSTTIPTANNAWASWDVKQAVLKNGWGTSLTLVLKAMGSTGYSNWYTKEYLNGTHAPRLIFEYEYVFPGTVIGKVQDRNGNIEVGAVVKGLSQTGDILSTAITDENGEFRLEGLVEGCRLLTEVDGYARTFTDVSFQEGGWADITVVLRETRETYNLQVIEDTYVHEANKGTNFSGNNWTVIWNSPSWNNHTYYKFQLPQIGSDFRVVSATLESFVWTNGDKIGTVGVYYCADNSWKESELTWNNSPHIAVENEPIGTGMPRGNNVWTSFNVTAAAKKAAPIGTSLTLVLKAMGSTGYSNWYSKEYTSGTHTPRLNLVLEYVEPGSVVGTVQDITGEPLPGATVRLFSPSGIEVASEITNIEGAFKIKGSDSGAHKLLIYLDGYRLEERSIEVNPNGWVDVSITLESFQAQLKLLPIADTQVAENAPNANYGKQTWIDLVPEGGYGKFGWYKFQLPQLDNNVTITAATFKNHLYGGTIEQEFTLHTSNDTTWQEMEITWANQPAYDKKPLCRVTPVGKGYVDFDLSPWLAGKSGDTISFVMKVTRAYSSWYTKEVTSSAPYIELVVVPVQKTLSGQVKDSWSSQPLDGVTVEVRDHKTQELKRSTITNDQGGYALSIAPGIYQLVIRKEGFVAQAQEFILEAGEDRIFDAFLEPVKISIQLRRESDPLEPVKNSLVRLKKDGVTVSVAEGDEAGTVMLTRVPTGEYEIELRAPGHEPKTIEIVMPVEDDLEVEETLEYTGDFTPPNPVEGFVLDSSQAGQVKISWKLSDGAEGVTKYSIYKANIDEDLDLNNPIAILDSTNDLWTDIDVVPQKYQFAIRSEDDSSNYSQLVGPLVVTPKPVFGYLEGWVKDTNGSPIAGVEIDLGFCKVFSDGSGYYIVSSIPSGDYTATAKREGYNNEGATKYLFKIRLNQLEHRYDFVLCFEEPPAGAREWLTTVTARPSPFIAGREGVTITHIPKEGIVITSVEIFDLNGRLVRDLQLSDPYWTYWDGLDRKGKPVASGPYLALIRAEQGRTFEQLRTTCIIIAIK